MTTAVPLTPPYLQFLDDNGNPLTGGTINTYQSGTTTNSATYTDSTGTTLAPNPIILDSGGIPQTGNGAIWGVGAYRIVVTSADGTFTRTIDPLTAMTISTTASPAVFQSFSGNGSQMAFTLSESVGTDPNAVLVFVSQPPISQLFNGNGTQTVFSLSQAVPNNNAASLFVTVNGGYIPPNSGYMITGTNTITFTAAPASGTNNIVVAQASSAPFSVLNPNQYSLTSNTLTINQPPPTGTNNIMIFSPSSAIGSASVSASAAQDFATSAATSSSSAAISAATAQSAAYFGTSTTSNSIGTGSITFTTQTGLNFQPGAFLLVTSTASPTNYFHGQITSYNISTGALVLNSIDIGGSGTFASWNIYVSGTRGASGPAASLTSYTNSISSNVNLNSLTTFFDGPTVSQGTVGTWLVTGSVTINDPTVNAAFVIKLHDGTNILDSTQIIITANFLTRISLSGIITSPAGNLRISVKDVSTTNGVIYANSSGLGKDSTISAVRIA